jgi:transmembrane sensor
MTDKNYIATPESEAHFDLDRFDPADLHYREALNWLLRLREREVVPCPEFEDWKARDPDHELAFAEMEALFNSSARAAHEAEYFFDPKSRTRRITRRWIQGGLALAASWVLFLALPPIPPLRYLRADAATGTGDVRTVRLQDGSQVTLNTRSAMDVKFDSHGRGAELLGGEAYFEIARDSTRPFQIQAGNAHVRVLGTKFNIYIEDDQTKIVVTHGRVEINSTKHPNDVAYLTEGQAAYVTASGITRQEGTKADTAWRNKKILFSYTPLRKVVHDLNRYRSAPIYIANGALGNSIVTGIFRTDDPEDSIRIIRRTLGIKSLTLPTGHTFLY